MKLNKNDFVNVMTGLCDLYNRVPSEFIFDVYYQVFQDYTLEEFKSAVSGCLRDRKYNSLPKPAEILEYLEGTKDDKALGAWIQAKEAVKKAGYYYTPDFQDPIISHCLLELGGWMEFCSCGIDELPFIEKRFLELYRLFLKCGVNKPERLIGFIDVKNMEKGYPKSQNVKIGYENQKLLSRESP